MVTSDNLKQKTDQALVLLTTKASLRISSLTKNDGEFMKLSLDIADLAGKELDCLKIYHDEIANREANVDQLAEQFHDFTRQRQADYARYVELAGVDK